MNTIEEPKGNNRQAVEQSASSVLAKDSGINLVSNRAARRRQERQGRKEMRGFGSVFRTSWYNKKTSEKKYSPRYTIKYYHNKVPIRELTHFTKESDAWRLLKKRHGELALGKPVGATIARTTFEDMAAMLVNDYKANARRSLARAEDALNHLRSFFGSDRATDITSVRVTAYVTFRQGEKAANATINTELAGLGRMFALGIRAGKIANKPHIAKLQLNNARKGFFESEQFFGVLKHLPDDIKPVAVAAYVTGWRVHDEILTRQKHHLDLKAGSLRLEPGETKNNEGRMFPLTPMLREALERQVQKTEGLQRAKGVIIPWLFHRAGKRIRTFRRSWLTACKAAGVPGKIPHDFRRTACRNLERAGVDRASAMKMIGHKTEAIYRRYANADEGMLKEAAEKLSLLHHSDEQKNGLGKGSAK
jgi:integrase